MARTSLHQDPTSFPTLPGGSTSKPFILILFQSALLRSLAILNETTESNVSRDTHFETALKKPALRMMATAVAERNGFSYSKNEELVEYEKLIKLRNDVFANSHPSPKLPRQSGGLGNPSSASGPLLSKPASSSQMTNGIHPLSKVSNATSSSAANAHVTKPSSHSLQPKSPNNLKIPTPAPASSGIDPILLTKSDVLVRAEIQQKRQRIERALEDQIHQRRKQKIFDQEALPEFDATEVLRKAQELVKPAKHHESSRANIAASSSDSFDEKTFYSSQVESTTTEEADESHKWRPHRICNFFLKGEQCRYGDACTFSHDPKLKQKLEADGSQTMDLDSINANEQTNSRPSKVPAHVSTNRLTPHAPLTKESNAAAQISESERKMQERIAQLEAELANRSKTEQQARADATVRHHAKEVNESQDDSAYSPPGPDEFGRDVDLREVEKRQPVTKQRPPPGDDQLPARELAARNGRSPSPLPNNVRVVRNHILSPVAPQPSRVSPLAVAKVPQVSQVRRSHGENRRLSRASNTEIASAGPSSKDSLQPLSSKKRRRGLDPQEHTRNVISRREMHSPDVRIKDEPVSPPPFGDAVEIRQIHPRQEAPRQLYIDEAAPQNRDQESTIYQPRADGRPAFGQLPDDRGPLTPSVHRVISRNGQRYMANEEQDLRRVVSARQVRAPVSPAPQPRSSTTRAISQVYISPAGQPMPQQYRASVQPVAATYISHDRSPSPPLRRLQASPFGRNPITMAPPPRRIMIDQWGRECIEVPINAGRQFSVAPVASRSEYDPRYEQSAPHGVRHPHLVNVDDEGPYVRRVQTPTSPSFLEYPRHRNTQVVETNSRNMPYAESYVARNQGPHPAEYPEARLAGPYGDAPEAREGVIRMQSARPIERQYEVPREQVTRVQSVRPQQPRIVQLGERSEGRGQVSRQVSVFADDGPMRSMSYAVEKRPRYQYTNQGQDRGYVEEMADDGGMYEAPGSADRRQVLR